MSEKVEPTSIAPTPSLPIHTRIRDADGFIGTVVYVGSVASSKNSIEQYAGIVWDDISRGKHDGSVVCRKTNKIVRHFSCGTTQGSFLKLRKIDLGLTLTAALVQDKYVKMNAPMIAPNNILPHAMTTSSGKEKTIEFMGELKIRKRQQLEKIERISLRREGISKTSDEEDLADFRHIKEIDLAGNLLCCWEQVFDIVRKFPLLENLSLAHNYIRDINTTITIGIKWDKMKILNLNNCFVRSFRTVILVAETMPKLESLCIANSNLSDVKKYDDIEGLQNLLRLDCTSCGFRGWENEVSKFARLPLLESLSLDDNSIQSIPSSAGMDPFFPSLLSLHISGTAILTWMDLEAINSFAALNALRFKNIPLTATLGHGEVRSNSIARFPKLDYLNASRISNEERLEAERRYLMLVSHSILKKTSDKEKNAFLKMHPRYSELADKHEHLTTYLKTIMEGGGNLATSIYNVTIKSMGASSCTMKPIVRRIPGSMNVDRMKAMCSRTFNVDYDLIRLRFRTDMTDSVPIEMDDESKTLDYYGLCDGAEVLMDEVDLRARALDSRRNDEELEERILELDRNMAVLQNVRSQR